MNKIVIRKKKINIVGIIAIMLFVIYAYIMYQIASMEENVRFLEMNLSKANSLDYIAIVTALIGPFLIMLIGISTNTLDNKNKIIKNDVDNYIKSLTVESIELDASLGSVSNVELAYELTQDLSNAANYNINCNQEKWDLLLLIKNDCAQTSNTCIAYVEINNEIKMASLIAYKSCGLSLLRTFTLKNNSELNILGLMVDGEVYSTSYFIGNRMAIIQPNNYHNSLHILMYVIENNHIKFTNTDAYNYVNNTSFTDTEDLNFLSKVKDNFINKNMTYYNELEIRYKNKKSK